MKDLAPSFFAAAVASGSTLTSFCLEHGQSLVAAIFAAVAGVYSIMAARSTLRKNRIQEALAAEEADIRHAALSAARRASQNLVTTPAAPPARPGAA